MKHIFENRSVSNWHQIKLVMSDLKRLENAKVLQKKKQKNYDPFYSYHAYQFEID